MAYSHSRLECFRNCPRQFKYRYVEEIEPETESIEAFAGKATHATLELLYTQPEVTLADLQAAYDVYWQQEHLPFEVIRYDEQHWRDHGWRCVLSYWRSINGKPNLGATLGVEQEVQFICLDRLFRGFVDRIDRRGDTLTVLDYKTGRVPTKRWFKPDQLVLYEIALRAKHPEVTRVTLRWEYLAGGQVIEHESTQQERDSVLRQALDTAREIEEAEVYPGRPSRLCDWCAYKSRCNAYEKPAF